MRIFYGFLIIVVSAILFMLPLTSLINDFRTDVREDTFTVTTGSGVTTDNQTLTRAIYDDDTDTIEITSSISDDTPLYSSYNTTTRLLAYSGLAASSTRVITVSYDVDALDSTDAIATFVDRLPWIWMLIIIAFPIAALAAIFLGRG